MEAARGATLEELIGRPQYTLTDHEKDEVLLPLLLDGVRRAQSNRAIRNLYHKQGIDPDRLTSLEEIPFIPVQMFKFFDMSIVPEGEVVRVLRSSGTTSQRPSQVPLDKVTASNQTKGLKAIMANYLGEKRKPMLVIDHAKVNDPGRELTARGAGVRGMSIYAKEIIYLLREEDGRLVLDQDALCSAQERFGEQEVYFFGFTYIIWSVFMKELERLDLRCRFRDSVVFHGGGWKKMRDQKVSSAQFSRALSDRLGTKAELVHDFYGMAEQTGVVFVECEHGHKHVPEFAQVLVRDMQTLEPCEVGVRGLVEVLSALGNSYYSQAILTEDVGQLQGVDDCPCGRKGRYFQVEGRVERAEVRGCGDTFREG